jgi:hypothetical protein
MDNYILNYKEYIDKTVDYLNNILPEGITIEGDYYSSILSIKAKTYILKDNTGKMTFKGVSLKGRGTEKFILEFIAQCVELIMDGKIDSIGYLYAKTRDDLINYRFPIENICKSVEIKKSVNRYLAEKKTTQPAYELMIRTGRNIEAGNRIQYYIDENDLEQFIDNYNFEKPDINLDHYLKRLEESTKRFYDKKNDVNILTEEQYKAIFKLRKKIKKGDKIEIDNFIFSDFHTFGKKSIIDGKEINSGWERKESTKEEILNYTIENPIDSFKTVQLFRSDNIDDEKHLCPLYFDFDAQITDDIKERIKSSTTIKEKIDILSSTITSTYTDLMKVIEYFKKYLGLIDENFEIYFSGFKGFHLFIPNEVFNITEGRTDLVSIYKQIAQSLKKDLDLPTLDIGSIYSKRRMMRLPFSINAKSGLMKVPLKLSTLSNNPLNAIINILEYIDKNNLDIIKLYDLKEKIVIDKTTNEIASTWLNNIIVDYIENSVVSACKKPSYKFLKIKSNPECISDILRFGIRKNGDRNKATMILAMYYKEIGMDRKEATKIITEWALKIPKELTTSTPSLIKSSTETCVNSIYNSDRYYFSCSSIKSLGTPQFPVGCLKTCVLS